MTPVPQKARPVSCDIARSVSRVGTRDSGPPQAWLDVGYRF